MSEKVLLVDGHSIANRAFYGVPLLSNTQGMYTNAVYGFFNILLKVMRMEEPTRIGVAFDLKHPTFRHEMFTEYKGTRSAMPQELREQIPVIKELLAAAKVPVYTMEGYEADDILGTLGKSYAHQGAEVTILSGDRDLLQLAEEHLKILIPKTQKGGTEMESYYPEDVLAKYGADPAGYLQMKALMGDSSDNIPGVPSIGEKTAAKIIAAFGTVENAIAHVSEVKPPKAAKNLEEYAEQARISLVLATILTEVPLENPEIPVWNESNMQRTEWLDLLRKYEFKSLLERFLPEEPQLTLDLDEKEVQILRTADDLKEYLKGAEELALQITEEEGRVYGLSCVVGGKEACWIPITETLTESMLAESLKPVLEEETVRILGHDIKEEIRWMFNQKIQPAGIEFDTMVAAYVLNPSKDTYTISELAGAYLNRRVMDTDEMLGTGAKRKKPWEVDEERWAAMMIEQVQAVMDLKPLLWKALVMQEMAALYTDIELPLIEVLASMEYEGIRVDRETLRGQGEYLLAEIDRIQKRIYDLAGEEFNINSPKQLGTILFEKLGLPAYKKTKSGYSTNAEVLDKLKGQYPIVEDILQYRQLTKLQSTYVEGLDAYIHPEDGKIHCRFQQTVTATGRLSSTEPNLQNIPIRMELGRQLRKAFIPRSEEYLFMDADYSQIELRLLAHMSKDEKMITAYQNGEDIHRLTASQVLDLPPEMITPAQRSNAKAVNFGIIYGISAFSLSDDLHISQKEAATYIKRYFAQYPSVQGFLEDCVSLAKENGYGVTIFGRKRVIDELKSSNFNMRSFGERVAKNMPIQGSAADIIKIAMIKVYQRIRKEGLQSRLIVQVHDELLLEVHRNEVEQVAVILEEEMMGAARLLVPLEIDVHTGENWYEAK